jgi:hypothetical protein
MLLWECTFCSLELTHRVLRKPARSVHGSHFDTFGSALPSGWKGQRKNEALAIIPAVPRGRFVEPAKSRVAGNSRPGALQFYWNQKTRSQRVL